MKKLRKFAGMTAAYIVATPAFVFLGGCDLAHEIGKGFHSLSERFVNSELADRWDAFCVSLEDWSNG